MTTTQQLELGFNGTPARNLGQRREQRVARAKWWFARMRDAVEKLVGDAVSECLLQERQSSGALTLDEMRDCLMVL